MLIRAYRPDDAEKIVQIMAQPDCYGNTLLLPYITEEVWNRYLNSRADHVLVLVGEVGDRIIAYAVLEMSSEQRRRHVAKLGMAVEPGVQGQGIGSTLLSALLEVADNWLALRRLELEVYANNEKALALYDKLGFQIEGTAREYAIRDGHYVDALMMARLRSDVGCSEASQAG